jgi:hypothetical protein
VSVLKATCPRCRTEVDTVVTADEHTLQECRETAMSAGSITNAREGRPLFCSLSGIHSLRWFCLPTLGRIDSALPSLLRVQKELQR